MIISVLIAFLLKNTIVLSIYRCISVNQPVKVSANFSWNSRFWQYWTQLEDAFFKETIDLLIFLDRTQICFFVIVTRLFAVEKSVTHLSNDIFLSFPTVCHNFFFRKYLGHTDEKWIWVRSRNLSKSIVSYKKLSLDEFPCFYTPTQ